MSMEQRSCAHCGRPVGPRATNCVKCYKKDWNKSDEAKKAKEKPAAAVCVDCKGPKSVGAVRCRSCANRINGMKQDQKMRNYGEARCDVCGKFFTKKAPHQTHCGPKCVSKFGYDHNAEYYRERDRIKVTKQRIGLDIRDEAMKTPSKDAKWLWDGIGKWSVKYWPDIQECLECNTSVYRHNAFGVCERCYDKLRPRDPAQVREWQKKSYEAAKAKGWKPSSKVAREWIAKAKEGKIPVTPKIGNLLDNLERL